MTGIPKLALGSQTQHTHTQEDNACLSNKKIHTHTHKLQHNHIQRKNCKNTKINRKLIKQTIYKHIHIRNTQYK